MYIAFKWLVGLCLALWIAMCCVDIFVKKNMDFSSTGCHIKAFEFLAKNISTPLELISVDHKPRFKYKYDKNDGKVLLHSFIFFAGALAVSVYNKKNEIILFTKSKISKIHFCSIFSRISLNLKRTAFTVTVATLEYSTILWELLKRWIAKLRMQINVIEKTGNPKTNTHTLLTKIKEMGDERRNLNQLLIAAMHENKNIRIQYELETMANSRLERYVADTQLKIKENRSKYVNFQHLYLVTHQENIFLKARTKKLKKEKDDAEKFLMGLMSEIFKSNNKELINYCSRCIVKTKDNLLNSDVKAEIDKFLEKSQRTTVSAATWQLSEQPNVELNTAQSWPKCTGTLITECLQVDGLVPLISDAPKLKGLPGEYVWTVKDKDGLIEKLYEYDSASDFDTGDAIKRIRQYSVYFDKDCLLDFSNSRTVINTIKVQEIGSHRDYLNVGYPVTNERFLTGSEAFRNFLQSNKGIVSKNDMSRSPVP